MKFREPTGSCQIGQDAMMAENNTMICPCPSEAYNPVREYIYVHRTIIGQYVMCHEIQQDRVRKGRGHF